VKINCADAMTMIAGSLCVSVDRVYALYNEFLDENLYTHQLPRAGRFSEPIVREQLPELAAYLADRTITPENWQGEISAARERFGDEFEIQTAAQAWQHIHPLEEPILKGKKVIVVEVPEVKS
jgi:hypothetical protein